MRIFFITCLSLFSFVYTPVFGKSLNDKKILQQIDLPGDVDWRQVIIFEGSPFAVGSKGSKSVLFNIDDKSSKVLDVDLNTNNIAFAGREGLYFAPARITLSKGAKNKILVFSRDGKQKSSVSIKYKYDCVLSYYFHKGLSRIFYSSIALEEFYSGKTNGNISGGIFSEKDTSPLLKFEYSPPPPPTRIPLPVTAIKDNIYLAHENEYIVEVYSLQGIKQSKIHNPYFAAQPYTKEEVEALPPMAQSTVIIGKTCPPIIEKMDIGNDGKLYVTRFPRPKSSRILVDIFKDKGKYVRTVELDYGVKGYLADSSVMPDDKYICLIKCDDGKSRIIKFLLN